MFDFWKVYYEVFSDLRPTGKESISSEFLLIGEMKRIDYSDEEDLFINWFPKNKGIT